MFRRLFVRLRRKMNKLQGIEWSYLGIEDEKFTFFSQRAPNENVLLTQSYGYKYQFVTQDIVVFKIICEFILERREPKQALFSGSLVTVFSFTLLNGADIASPYTDLRIFIAYLTAQSESHLRAYKDIRLKGGSFEDLIIPPLNELPYYLDIVNAAIGTRYWENIDA